MFAKRTSIIAIFVLACLAAGPLGALPHEYPRVANFYTTDPRIEDCPRISRYDLIVMPAAMNDIKPEIITTVRELNPDVIILAYFPVALIGPITESESRTNQVYLDMVEENDWWLYDDKGNRVGNPDYWWILNVTTKCPRDPYGRTHAEWLASYIADEIMATGVWDGMWLDGCWEDPIWLNSSRLLIQDWPAMVDSDNDGIGDDPESLMVWWRTALTQFMTSLRSQVGDDAILLGNDIHYYHDVLNGAIREKFPRMHGDWFANMFSDYGYVTACNSFRSYPLNGTMMSCFSKYPEHTAHEPYRCPSYLKFLRFTLTSSLLGDGYLALENASGRCLWWEDLYDIDIGNPVGPAYLDSICSRTNGEMYPIWRRDFQKGIVYCNPFIQYIYTEDNKWIFPEDGLIRITESDVPLELSAVRDSVPRLLEEDVGRTRLSFAVANPSAHSAPAYVWTVTKLGDTVVHSEAVREFLIGKSRTDTVTVVAGFPAILEPDTYTIEGMVAGPDLQVISTDTVNIEIFEDGTTTDVSEEGSFLVYPQPVNSSSGGILRMEVRGIYASADEICHIRMYDVRGRLVRSLYEGVYGEGLKLEFRLTSTGGEEIAPGLYVIVLELGDLAQTKKIVLLK
jgi:hypothetical protein